MPITNWFEPEELIVDTISDLFPDDMVFTVAEKTDLDNNVFNAIDNDSDKVGVIVRNRGFTPGTLVCQRKNVKQKITQLYEVSITTPREFYKLNMGVLILSVISRLNGQRLSPSVKVKELADDKQYKNEPIYENNLAYLPLLFEIELVI